MIAKKELKRSEIEARSIDHVKSLNVGLENKFISLQQKLEEMEKENAALKTWEKTGLELQARLEKLKLAEFELQTEKLVTTETEFRDEIKKLKKDNERQQKLINKNLQETPQAQTEAIMQHEITRLTGENLNLREKIDNLREQNRKSKKQLKIYAQKLKDAGVELEQSTDALDLTKYVSDNMPEIEIKHAEVGYLGMFEYKQEDEQLLIKTLIDDLTPKLAVTMLPGLPAYIIFMCVRHTDLDDDSEKVISLLSNTYNGVRRIRKKRDLEITVMWLANMCRLLHCLKQYSGHEAFQKENTPSQNNQCLGKFNLSKYWERLSNAIVKTYEGVVKMMETKVQALIVPAVLEHEAIPSILGKRSGLHRRSSITRVPESPVDPQNALNILLKELTGFYRVLTTHGVDPEILTQVFRQIYYDICARALNNLLLRQEMCHWSKGMQIQKNLSLLEQWCVNHKLQNAEVTEPLQPVVQASRLLQAKKTDEDVTSICEMCDKLSVTQIIKIVNLYTPADEFEEQVPKSFVSKIQAKLKERDENYQEAKLLMDTKFRFSVCIPFNPSSIRLEDISIPDQLNLPFIKKV